ncbi:MAG: ArnT family glycosyltransferase [Chloroflexota bacterium]
MPPSKHRALAAPLTGVGALLGLLAAAGGSVLREPLHADLQMALFAAGLVALCAGMGGAHLFNPRRARPGAPYIALALTLLLAFGLRVVALGERVHLFVDEMHFVEGVIALRADPHTALLEPRPGIAAFSWFYADLQARSVALLGPSLLALRLASAVFGTLTVAAVYLLGVWLGDRRAGLLAALLLATFPPHVHFSRLAFNNIADPFFGTLALACLVRGLRSTPQGRLPWFGVAGVLLALTQYWYEGGKLVYPALIITWAGALLLRGRLQPRAAGRLALGFALATLPLALALASSGARYMPRLEATTPTDYWFTLLFERPGFEALREYVTTGLGPALGHYVVSADGSAFYYGGYTPLILPVLLPFFVWGLAVLIRRGGWLLPGLLLLVALGNSLNSHPDWSARFVVTFPALAVITALGLAASARALARPGRPARRLAGGAAALLALVQIVYYFGPHLHTYNHQVRPERDYQDVIFRARDFPPGTSAVLLTDEAVFLPHFETLSRFWGLDVRFEVAHPLQLTLRSPSRLPMGGDLALFVQPGNTDLLAFVAQALDLPEPQFSPYNVPRSKQYALYYVDADE